MGQSVCSVSIGNRDIGAIVNGFPHDSVEKRPFDKCFTYVNIFNTWITVGFLPMTGNAVNDPNVRYESGKGGAPEEAGRCMELSVQEYEECAQTLNRLGFNGDVLNLEVCQVEENGYPSDEERQTEHIVKNKLVNKAGGWYKAGIVIANSRVVIEAAKRRVANEI